MLMKPSRVAAIVFGLANLVCPILAPASFSQTTPSPCTDSMLPGSVNELLKARFPKWRPKRLLDMDAGDQQLWLKGPNGKACPGIAIGHFENADELSYAVLLVPQSNPGGGHKIVVFGKTKDVYSVRLLDQAEGQTYSGLVISRTGPGKYDDWENTKSIQIELDGLRVEWMEQGAQLYYWRAGRYRKLQVSD